MYPDNQIILNNNLFRNVNFYVVQCIIIAVVDMYFVDLSVDMSTILQPTFELKLWQFIDKL